MDPLSAGAARTIYEGIASKMADLGDTPATDEVPEIEGQTTVAYGRSGTRYVYVRETNTVYPFDRAPADPGPSAGGPAVPLIDLRGRLPTRPGAKPYYSREIHGLVGATIHYTAGSPQASVEDVARYQVGSNAQEAFPAIAYHLIIPAAGYVVLCHDLSTRVWHSGAVVNGVARNTSHIGICYIGNREPSLAQLAGIRGALRWCEQQLGRPLEHIEGHRDAPYATACPGPTWPFWRDEILGH
jgi:hypothetical protein